MTAAYFEDHPTGPDKVILRKPRLDQGPDYERGFIDGMQHQMQSSVDKAVNRMATPKQKAVAWKLVPVEPTREMLEAMDECSTEGYDERLLAGHAASVYMAAVDVAPTPPQPEQEPVAYCDIHHLPEPCVQCAKEHEGYNIPPQPKEPEQEPVAHFGSAYVNENGVHVTTVLGPVAIPQDAKLYTTPPQRTWVGLTKSEITTSLPYSVTRDKGCFHAGALWAEAKLKEKNT